MPDGEYIFYLLYCIPNNNNWKMFLQFMEDKEAEDIMWPSIAITKMQEHEEQLKQQKGLGHDTLLFAKQGKGKGKGNGKDKKGKGKSDDKKDKKPSGSSEMICHHCQNKGHIIRECPSKKHGEKATRKPEEKKDTVVATVTMTVDNFWMAAELDVSMSA